MKIVLAVAAAAFIATIVPASAAPIAKGQTVEKSTIVEQAKKCTFGWGKRGQMKTCNRG